MPAGIRFDRDIREISDGRPETAFANCREYKTNFPSCGNVLGMKCPPSHECAECDPGNRSGSGAVRAPRAEIVPAENHGSSDARQTNDNHHHDDPSGILIGWGFLSASDPQINRATL